MTQNEKAQIPGNMTIERAQTQKDVNRTVLTCILNLFPADSSFNMLDLPCGNGELLNYVKLLFPSASLHGADMAVPHALRESIGFVRMDLTKPFLLPAEEQFDIITSVSGVMMFGNTLSFIENCTSRLKNNGHIIVTNDNSSTVIDRLAFLFTGRHRMFKQVFEDEELLTQNVPIQELCRLMRLHNVEIKDIVYTSFYWKDLIYLPIALIIYPFQWLSLMRLKTNLPRHLTRKMWHFRQYLYKHYIIVGTKR